MLFEPRESAVERRALALDLARRAHGPSSGTTLEERRLTRCAVLSQSVATLPTTRPLTTSPRTPSTTTTPTLPFSRTLAESCPETTGRLPADLPLFRLRSENHSVSPPHSSPPRAATYTWTLVSCLLSCLATRNDHPVILRKDSLHHTATICSARVLIKKRQIKHTLADGSPPAGREIRLLSLWRDHPLLSRLTGDTHR